MKLNVCKILLMFLLMPCNFLNINYVQFLVTGIQWSNMFVVGNTQYNITGCIGFILIFSIIGAFLHFILTIYINAIHPGKYGVRKDPLYFLKVNFYFVRIIRIVLEMH